MLDSEGFESKEFPSRILVILGLSIFFAIVVLILTKLRIQGAGLLYVAMPIIVTVILLFSSKRNPHDENSKRYRTVLLDSIIIFLASSVILLEGFICIIFFIPIYTIVVLAVFLIEKLWLKSKESRVGRPMVSILPLLLFLTAFEGTHEDYAFEVKNEITVSRIIDSDVKTIKQNLVKPSALKSPTKGFMKVFPSPEYFDAQVLEVGQLHTIRYTYNRWIIDNTNTHKGHQITEILTVSDNLIETQMLEDTSYISTYMKIDGTRMLFERLSLNQTKVTLTIKFERLLHPGWYFTPIQRFGVEALGESILDQLVENRDEL